MQNTKSFAKVSALAVVLTAMIILFTGCNKTAATNDSFESLADEKGLEIVDATDQFADYDFIEKVTIAISDDGSYQFEFYVLSEESDAQSFFAENKAIFEQAITGTHTESSSSGENFSKYTATTDDKYMFLEYIDNTALYINVDKSYKSQAEEFIKGLGY